jgi:hypothetical protein
LAARSNVRFKAANARISLKERREMKIQTREILVVASMMLLIAPVSILAQGLPHLEVSDPQLRYDVNSRFNLHTANSTTSARSPLTITYPIGEVSALFSNTGTKSIKSVTWEYLFFKDATESELLKIHTSRAKTVLLPGESVRLRKEGYNLEPMVPIRKVNRPPYKKARVVQIEYTDGTIWRGVKTRR